MKRVAVVLIALVLSRACAQALATPRATDPSLIFELLGSAETLELEMPENVQHLFVQAMYEGESVLSDDRPVTKRDGGMPRAVVTAGALSNANSCPLLLFAHTALEEEGRAFASGHSSYCLVREGSPTVRRAPLSVPLVFDRPTELPLDTWLAFEAARVEAADNVFDPDDPNRAVVFYLHLSTAGGSSDPGPPDYATWHEIGRSYHQGGAE